MVKNISMISPRELEGMRINGQPIELIDVRTPAEYRDCHAISARNVQFDSPELQEIMEDASRETPLYIICQSGIRAQKVCEKFNTINNSQIVNVEGGTQAWQEAGLPVVRGRKTLSLERQVRITVGTLVLVGTVLGWLVHPAFTGLVAFVGVGLVFSGITDSCAMAMLLTKMPWNQVSQECENGQYPA